MHIYKQLCDFHYKIVIYISGVTLYKTQCYNLWNEIMLYVWNRIMLLYLKAGSHEHEFWQIGQEYVTYLVIWSQIFKIFSKYIVTVLTHATCSENFRKIKVPKLLSCPSAYTDW